MLYAKVSIWGYIFLLSRNNSVTISFSLSLVLWSILNQNEFCLALTFWFGQYTFVSKQFCFHFFRRKRFFKWPYCRIVIDLEIYAIKWIRKWHIKAEKPSLEKWTWMLFGEGVPNTWSLSINICSSFRLRNTEKVRGKYKHMKARKCPRFTVQLNAATSSLHWLYVCVLCTW